MKCVTIALDYPSASQVDESVRATWEVATAKWRQGAALAVADLKRSRLLHRRVSASDDAVDLMYSLMSVDLIRCLVDKRSWSPA